MTETTELYGRRVIRLPFTDITAENAVSALYRALPIHRANVMQMNRLIDYYRGKQDIRFKVKATREEINHKVTENRAKQIVDFSVGYQNVENIQYVARGDGAEDAAEKVAYLDSRLKAMGKSGLDRSLFEWNRICGTAYRYIEQDETAGEDALPIRMAVPDPRDAFVVYSDGVFEEPIMGVHCGRDESRRWVYTVYTGERQLVIREKRIISDKPYFFGEIPIIEYPANSFRMGVFEPVISMLNQINETDSDRADAITQFVSSLLVFYNCELGEGEDGKPITPEYIRAAGAIFLRSMGDDKADLKEIASQLDQQQTQVYKKDLWDSVREIVGLPGQSDGSTSDSSNNGAMIVKNGWWNAEASAKAAETMFSASEVRLLRLMLRICAAMGSVELKPTDITIKAPRRNYEDIVSKSTVLTTLLNTPYVHPQIAYEASNLFVDTQTAYDMGMRWQEEKDGAEAPEDGAPGAEAPEDGASGGDGGAVTL